MPKKITFLISSLTGGGAERVVSVLASELSEKGYTVTIALSSRIDVVYPIPPSVQISLLQKKNGKDSGKNTNPLHREKSVTEKKPSSLPLLSFVKRYRKIIAKFRYPIKKSIQFRRYCRYNRPDVVFAFMPMSCIIMLLSRWGRHPKQIICERNNPVNPNVTRDISFLRKILYPHADAGVFQTPEQMAYFPKPDNRRIIPNPLKEGLPAPYTGVRRKEIISFGRLHPQKNLPCLIEAFSLFALTHKDYTLCIYGKGEEKDYLLSLIREKGLENRIRIENFQTNIHEIVSDAAMYVSTSDYEGLSNAMLESMAIGLPVICTDCDGGGARMMIQDHKNGILVPRGDAEAVAKAMAEIADDEELARHLSENAAKLREELSCEKVVSQWIALIEELCG